MTEFCISTKSIALNNFKIYENCIKKQYSNATSFQTDNSNDP